MKKIAMLHTSFVFFDREPLFFQIFEEILPDVEVFNIIDDLMAGEVIQHGHVTPEITRRVCHHMLSASEMQVDAIFNTCSSIGPAIDVARTLVDRPVVKIDDAMTERAALEGERIAILATSGSTLQPTRKLILRKAKRHNRTIETRDALCDGAFNILVSGKIDLHDDLVAQRAKDVAGWADTLVLAQGSMTRLAPRLADETGLRVLTSPRLGFEQLRDVLTKSGKNE
jgi:Asp/Glu/hydantoin racemase